MLLIQFRSGPLPAQATTKSEASQGLASHTKLVLLLRCADSVGRVSLTWRRDLGGCPRSLEVGT
jgi:hypothetical protein